MKFPKIYYLLTALLLVGCATSDLPPLDTGASPVPQEADTAGTTGTTDTAATTDTPDTNTVVTPEQVKAYAVGRYEDPSDPTVMHEGHTVYRASSPQWNTAPNEPTSLPLGPGEMAEANPAQQHVVLTAELEQRLKQEDQLLQTTYEQNQRLAEELKRLEEQRQHTLMHVPPVEPRATASPGDTQNRPNSRTSPETTTQPKSWFSWPWSASTNNFNN